MLVRSLCLCLVLTGATTAFGQQQQVSVQVEGGRVVGQYIPDNQPEPDGYVPIQQRQAQSPQGSVQQQHQHQHAHNCTCGQCKRTVVGRTRQVFAKTHMTVVTTEHSVIDHGVQSFNESPAPCPTPQRNPCPPRNPCAQPGVRIGTTGGLATSWDTGFQGYRGGCQLPMRSGFGGGNLLTVNAGFGVLGYGPQLNASVGRNPPMQALPSWR